MLLACQGLSRLCSQSIPSSYIGCCTMPKHLTCSFCFNRNIFDQGPEERGCWLSFLLKARRTHLCYRTRQRLQGQRIKAREKNKNRNKNWKERKRWRRDKESVRIIGTLDIQHVSNSRNRNRGSITKETCTVYIMKPYHWILLMCSEAVNILLTVAAWQQQLQILINLVSFHHEFHVINKYIHAFEMWTTNTYNRKT